MLSSLMSLWISEDVPSATRFARSQPASSGISGEVQPSVASSERLTQPSTARSRNPWGLPRSPRPTSAGSTACNRTSTSTMVSTRRSPMCGIARSGSGSVARTAKPRRNSTIWNGAPITVGSWQRCSPGGVSEKPEERRVRMRNSSHVVGAGRQLAHGRTSQHRFAAIDEQQVVEIRQATGELARARGQLERHAMPRQMRSQTRPLLSHCLRLGRSSGSVSMTGLLGISPRVLISGPGASKIGYWSSTSKPLFPQTHRRPSSAPAAEKLQLPSRHTRVTDGWLASSLAGYAGRALRQVA